MKQTVVVRCAHHRVIDIPVLSQEVSESPMGDE